MRIGIIGAMDKEVEYLSNTIEGCVEEVRNGYQFFSGKIHGKEVVLLKSGIGKVSAAIGATILIKDFGVTSVLNIGSAGGVSTGLAIGDMLVSTKIAYHDFDLTVFGYEYGQVPNRPLFFEPNKDLLDLIQSSKEVTEQFSVKYGLIVSGDQFINGDEQLNKILGNFDNVLALDMESACIAQTCDTFEVPFIIMRTVSDFVDKNAHEENLEEISENCAKFVIDIIGKM
ncbi:MAG: 5'-methylthioadenosine/adenosylhomocysteine nucleosidase [Cytophagales bacterium]|nr:5'-methylthioadenosine/adenosylhomocysteine nucleosidase [Cytophagales bacterium]